MEYKYSFERLEAWQISRKLVTDIFQVTQTFPDSEKYGLTNQIRRSAVSISSNIVESTSRNSPKDQNRFFEIAYGSAVECLSQLIIANDLNFIEKNQLKELRSQLENITRKLSQLRKSNQTKNHLQDDELEYTPTLNPQPTTKPSQPLTLNPQLIHENDYQYHFTAIIDENTKIGKGTKIWHFSHIMSNCVIGENCNLGQNVVISPGVVLGNNVKVQNNVSIYTGVTCEDDVFLGPSCVFTNVTNPRSAVNRRGQYAKTNVGKGASIGANATIVCGHDIGAYAFIGAGAVVTKDVPAYALLVGNPARQIGWMSEYGHRLEFDENGEAVCPESGQRYMLKEGAVSKL